jgi:hypothetical protein
VQAVMKMNIVQAPKMSMQKPTRHNNGEGRRDRGSERDTHLIDLPGYVMTARAQEDLCATREVCLGVCRTAFRRQRLAREGQSRPGQMTDGLVIPMKPGNAGGGKGP